MPSEPGTVAIATGDHDATAVEPGRLILVAGASGYVGGRLVAELLEAGYRVRCLVRTPAKVAAAPWADRVEIVHGDVLEDLDARDGGCRGGLLPRAHDRRVGGLGRARPAGGRERA